MNYHPNEAARSSEEEVSGGENDAQEFHPRDEDRGLKDRLLNSASIAVT